MGGGGKMLIGQGPGRGNSGTHPADAGGVWRQRGIREGEREIEMTSGSHSI
jgi:hypothetical protein